MKLIKLTQGKSTMIDDSDYDTVSKHKWYMALTSGAYPYAYRNVWNGKRQKMLAMHRQITNAKEGEMVDHINGDTLDNRRENLKICSRSENGLNNKRHRLGLLSGTTKHKRSGKYQAQIRRNGVTLYLGLFSTEKEAHDAYIKNQLDNNSL